MPSSILFGIAALNLIVAIVAFIFRETRPIAKIIGSFFLLTAFILIAVGIYSPPPNSTEISFQESVDSAQILFQADLNNPQMPGWDIWGGDSSNLYTENNKIYLLSQSGNGPQLHSQYGLQEDEACLILIKYSNETEFQLTAVAGSVFDSTWRSWGISRNPGISFPDGRVQAVYSIGIDESSWHGQTFGIQDKSDNWFYVLLWVRGPSSFYTRMWEKDHVEVFADKQFRMDNSQNWSGRRWSCTLLNINGLIEVSEFKILRIK
jgi:hypothetical protein